MYLNQKSVFVDILLILAPRGSFSVLTTLNKEFLIS
nr:MAG TPA: hypothetical protein [Caudoviricetes sp.]